MMRKIIETLAAIPAMSGDEYEVLNYIKENSLNRGLKVNQDRLGTVLVSNKNETKNKLLISANIDENGFLIKKFIDKGVAELLPIRNFNVGSFSDRKCIVLDRNHNRYPGFITLSEGKYICYVDEESIRPGDTVVIKDEIQSLNESLIVGSQLDNRACASIMYGLMMENKFGFNTEFSFTPQSLVGSRAAVTSVTLSNPSLAIILVSEYVAEYLPNSIYVRYFDKGMLPSKRFIDVVTRYLKSHDLNVEPNFDMKINDSSLIHKSLQGVPSIVLVLPLRHKSDISQILDLRDVELLKTALEIVSKYINQEDIDYINFGGAHDAP